ncbi:MAG TPA: putative DNA-binding protein [Firmicutes bacterium]|nr:putative DNA-binding protein [Bacillota bacterium]
MIDQTVHMGLLFDFYGQLLTEKQRLFFSLYHQDDLSLGEIAEQYGVTRQAVYDIIQRSQKTLINFEEKLGLIKRHIRQREQLERLQKKLKELADELAQTAASMPWQKQLAEAQALLAELIEEF